VMTDGVAFAETVERKGHLHLRWRCPDCGRIGIVGFCELEENTESFRSFCGETGREFLVISDAVLLSECDGVS
jgi:hypothetical protein